MSFIKHHKKFVALFVVLSFLYLVEISYLPLRAEPAPAKAPVSMNGDDQTPGSIEQEGGGYVHKKKSSPILPIIIGVVVLGAVAAVLILVVFKTKYNIVGTWTLTYTFTSPYTYSAVFTGDKKSGTVLVNNIATGPYTVDGKNVHLYWTLDVRKWDCTGTFTSKTAMSGTALFYSNSTLYYTGTWSAIKNTSASVKANTNKGIEATETR